MRRWDLHRHWVYSHLHLKSQELLGCLTAMWVKNTRPRCLSCVKWNDRAERGVEVRETVTFSLLHMGMLPIASLFWEPQTQSQLELFVDPLVLVIALRYCVLCASTPRSPPLWELIQDSSGLIHVWRLNVPDVRCSANKGRSPDPFTSDVFKIIF